MLTIELNMYHAVALGAFLFWLGSVITDKVSLLSRYCIPAPLVGGLCFSILNCILYSMGIASINFDATLQTVFMIMSSPPSASRSVSPRCSRAAKLSSCALPSPL